ncbi:tripartite tricarboxylate transporter TctB family protein [uncultured Tateyamaria sp.]|uniref:tripartite tricarboxylate transporter TctB family protein n=1 Tax=Tateyamaria sp. 1078 TaxID=3417464 RepID=UPI0026129F40|nr:tripartite tricarboxylate transporter TctB family protein [uncultured Tateyamaria sp.]
MNRFLHRDIAAAAGLLALGGYALWEAQSMSVFGAIFPQLAGAGMVLGAILLALRALIWSPALPTNTGTVLRPLLMLAALAAWAILLPVTGFVATSVVGAGVCMIIAQQHAVPFRTLALQGAGLTALVLLVALLFGRLLNVPLP